MFQVQLLGLLSLWLFCFGLVGLTICDSLPKIGVCLIIFILFSTWGHVVVYPIYYIKGRILEGFLWGTILGIALASLITSLIVYIVGWNLLIIVSAVTLFPALVLSVWGTRVRGSDELCACATLDPRLLLAALVLVTLFFYFPFKNLGLLVADKHLYAWLFGHDFLNRIVHVNSVSSGLPLEGFFFSGEKLSYYWLAYVLPALIHNVAWITLDLQQVLQTSELLYSLLTAASLIMFLNRFVHHTRLLIVTMVLAFCCYSYIGSFVILSSLLKSVFGEASLNAFGYDLAGFSGFSHSFYRFFLVEPQATLGLSIMAMILSLYDRQQTYYSFVVVGLLLGLLFGVEATNGIMFVAWFVGATGLHLWMNKDERKSVAIKHFSSLICFGAICFLLFAIQMYSFGTGKGVLRLSVNWFPVVTGPFYFILAYGPPCLFGVAGLYKLFMHTARSDDWLYPYVLLLAISVFFVLFVKNPTEEHFGLLKATRIIPLCLLAFTSFWVQDLLKSKKLRRVAFVLILLALPTLITDNLVASDICNPSTYVRDSDMEAARWIRNNLPKGAIIQAEPNYPGTLNGRAPKYSYSFVPIFAERRAAIGEWKVSSVEHSKAADVGERFHSVKQMFSTTDVDECTTILKKYNIGYIYVGELERVLYQEGIKKFGANGNFESIYSRNKVSIFKFKNL